MENNSVNKTIAIIRIKSLLYRILGLIIAIFCGLFAIVGTTQIAEALDVFLVESALPVVTQVTVLAGAYGADDKYAATGSCLSIFCSFITIPILMMILG